MTVLANFRGLIIATDGREIPGDCMNDGQEHTTEEHLRATSRYYIPCEYCGHYATRVIITRSWGRIKNVEHMYEYKGQPVEQFGEWSYEG